MKKQIMTVITMLSLLATLAMTGSASSSGKLRVSIPFDFMVGKTRLKAGSYTVDSTFVRGVPLISSTDRRTSVFAGNTFDGQTSRAPSRASLVFRRYGNEYFLSQIWDEGSTVPMQLYESRAERELAKQLKYLARNTVEPELVTCLAE